MFTIQRSEDKPDIRQTKEKRGGGESEKRRLFQKAITHLNKKPSAVVTGSNYLLLHVPHLGAGIVKQINDVCLGCVISKVIKCLGSESFAQGA